MVCVYVGVGSGVVKKMSVTKMFCSPNQPRNHATKVLMDRSWKNILKRLSNGVHLEFSASRISARVRATDYRRMQLDLQQFLSIQTDENALAFFVSTSEHLTSNE